MLSAQTVQNYTRTSIASPTGEVPRSGGRGSLPPIGLRPLLPALPQSHSRAHFVTARQWRGCGNCAIPASATGSGRPQFPRGGSTGRRGRRPLRRGRTLSRVRRRRYGIRYRTARAADSRPYGIRVGFAQFRTPNSELRISPFLPGEESVIIPLL